MKPDNDASAGALTEITHIAKALRGVQEAYSPARVCLPHLPPEEREGWAAELANVRAIKTQLQIALRATHATERSLSMGLKARTKRIAL